MKNKPKNIIIIALFIFFALSSFAVKSASADMSTFLSTVVSQAQNLAPQAYQAQQRGFFVGGSMTIPPQGVSIQPISFTPPSLSMNGCGAINLTMGGFSYMNPQYLMQKLQGIIQMAPSFALEIAIKILSEQAGNVMNFLEHMSDFINSLNVNSCHAMSTIAANILPNSMDTKLGIEKDNAAASQANGGSGWFGGVTAAYNNAGSALSNWWKNTAPPSGQSLVDFEDENCAIANGASGVLRTAANDVNMGSIPPDFIDFIRAYVGDVVPAPNSNVQNGCYTSVVYLSGPIPITELQKDFTSAGNIEEISGTGLASGGQPTAVPFTSFQAQVQATLQDILNNLQPGVGNGSLSNGDIQLINESSIPLYPFLKNAVLANNSAAAGSIIEELSKPVAINIAYNILTNYIHQVGIMLTYEESNLQQGTLSSGSTGSVGAIKELLNNLVIAQREIYQTYYISLTKMQESEGNFSSQYAELQNEVNNELKKTGYGEYLSKINGGM